MKRTIKKYWLILISGTLISTFLMAALPAAAFAAAPESQGQMALEKDYSMTKRKENHYSNLLTNADKKISMVQNRIARLQANGLDTTALQADLSVYQAQVASAQAFADDAANMLASHSGFSDNKVTDMSLARQTMNSVGHDQFMINSILSSANLAFNKAYARDNLSIKG